MLNIIPQPQNINVSDKTIVLSTFSHAKVSNLSAEHLAMLNKHNPEMEIEMLDQGFFFAIYSEVCPKALTVTEGFDAYSLSVTENGIRADANTAEGLFYALQTFLQLPSVCNCVNIRDYANVKYRIVHLDLKGYLPHLHVLKEEIRRLASYKVNGILLEIEDKYQYQCAPEIGVDGAYSFEEMREISKFAKSLYITIIPLLQCIAHVDYILKHERYKHLRENNHVFQFCPTNPAVHTLWTSMCDELLECFSEHGPYFHIGADEPDVLGECSTCATIGKAACYLQKVNECAKYIVSKQKTPIIWDDIIRNQNNLFTHDEAIQLRKTLGKNSIIMYWSYGYGGVDNEFPYTEEYQNIGNTVWGASGYAGCDNWVGSIPPLEIRGMNCDAWAKEAASHNLEGICATGWSRIGSADCPAEPIVGSWFSMLYASASMWNPVAVSYAEFIDLLSLQLYGITLDNQLKLAVLNISKYPYELNNLKTESHNDCTEINTLRLLSATESLTVLRNRLMDYAQYYELKLGKQIEDHRYKLLSSFISDLLENLSDLKGKLINQLSEYYKKVTVDEYISTRIDTLERYAKQFAGLLEKTELY